MRVLVTGGTGFVGSHMVEFLVNRGHEVKVLVRETSDLRWIADLSVTLCKGDLEDVTSLDNALEGVEWVFHVAGVTKALGYAAYLRGNAEGTRCLMEACLKQRESLLKMVVLSSLAASGPCWAGQPKREMDPCMPVSHYGLSKHMAEQIAISYADRLPLTVLRPSAVYGPRDRDFLATFRLIKRGWNPVVGSGELHLCLVHVRDLIEGILSAAETDARSGTVFFLSDGEVHTWSRVVRLLEEIMAVRVRTVRIPFSAAWIAALASEQISRLRGLPPILNRQRVREWLQEGWACDIQQAVKVLGFEPRVPLEEGLRETYDWYREQGWI